MVKVPDDAQGAPDIVDVQDAQDIVKNSEKVVSEEQDIPITLHKKVIDSSEKQGVASDDGESMTDGTYSIGDFLAVDFRSLLLPAQVCNFITFSSLFCHIIHHFHVKLVQKSHEYCDKNNVCLCDVECDEN